MPELAVVPSIVPWYAVSLGETPRFWAELMLKRFYSQLLRRFQCN